MPVYDCGAADCIPCEEAFRKPRGLMEKHLCERAYGILFRFSLENTGWRRWTFGRWHHSHEALRNDAARLVRQVGYLELQPYHTKRVDDTP